MKNIKSILFLLVTVSYMSCVNRIDIPEEEESKLFISLEMLTGENTIAADFKTTNNLNGSFPITSPNSAIITITEEKAAGLDDDNEIILEYDGERYVANNTQKFLKRNKKYILNAVIENSEFEVITSETKVPNLIDIEDSELLSERKVIDSDGNEYWESTVGLTFVEGAGYENRYGHLIIKGDQTERIISVHGDTTYIHGPEKRLFTLSLVNVGNSAITNLIHRDGFLVDLSKLEDNYLELVLRSNFPNTKPTHVTDFLFIDLFAVTEAHHDYHVSLHNIKKSKGNIFDEHALYISNIENGLGLFSSCASMTKTLEIR